MLNPLFGMTIVLIVFCTLLIMLRTWQRKYRPDPEWVRKLFHIGMGLFTLALPWLFAEAWPVWVMCGVTVGWLLVMRVSTRLQQTFGAVLGDVARCSHGEFYFSLGVATLFTLSRNDRVAYCIAILLLTFADAAAALVGKRLGAHRYQSLAGQKSLEGSCAFLIVAVLCIAAPLLIGTVLPLATTLLLSLTLALPLTLLEALAGRGLDNLLLPLASYGLFAALRMCTTEELSLWLMCVLLISAFLLCITVMPSKGNTKLRPL